MGEVKEHVFGETIRRMDNQVSFSRRSAPLVISQALKPSSYAHHMEAPRAFKGAKEERSLCRPQATCMKERSLDSLTRGTSKLH
eukprot:296161-Pelagomonas_calceolata.AAC.1